MKEKEKFMRFLGLILMFGLVPLVPPRVSAETQTAPSQELVADTLGKVPLAFEANIGQSDPAVHFVARGNGYAMFFTSSSTVFILDPAGEQTPPATLAMRLVGGEPNTSIIGEELLPTQVNQFIGQDQTKWFANIPTYAKVRYRGVYPGVDLIYFGNQQALEYDFVIAPGADPRNIKFTFDQAEQITLDESGNLVLSLAGKNIILKKPLVYQEINAVKQEISSSYMIGSDNTVALQTENYDKNFSLVVDPVLNFSAFFGGEGFDSGFATAVDASGNIYFTGTAASSSFPAGIPLVSPAGGGDVFVAKINPNLPVLSYFTLLGGSGYEEGKALAVDSLGNVYITGLTVSSNFPTTLGAFQKTLSGPINGFVAKLNSTGTLPLYSTYLGGGGGDLAFGIAVDSSGNAYVAGRTFSTNFPTSAGAFQTALSGAVGNAFVTKLNSTGTGLVYSTYLGGNSNDLAFSIAVDSSGNAYVGGEANSTNFPTSAGAFQTALSGRGDAFVAKLNSTGTGLVYSTYLGGSNASNGDRISAIAVDSSGNVYATGITFSADFPTVNAVQPLFGGFTDAFVVKLNSTGSALVYSTFLGGSQGENGAAIAVDSSGNAYITGNTVSSDFPTSSPFQSNWAGGNDVFVTELNSTGSAYVYSSFLGGSSDDQGNGISVDASGNTYLIGMTRSADFPTVKALQGVFSGGGGDAFVARISTGSNTAKGNNVLVSLSGGLTVTFNRVSGAGMTTVLLTKTAVPPPAGYQLGITTVYDVATTASFSGDITVCFAYREDGVVGGETGLRLMKLSSGVWSNITTSLDIVNNKICATTASLGTFALMTPNTAVGTNVIFAQNGVTLTFDQITAVGQTSVTLAAVPVALLPGYQLVDAATSYNITTTASFKGNVQVCLNYSSLGFSGKAADLRILQLQSGVWIDINTSLDTVLHTICVTTTSLGSFAVTVAPNTPAGANVQVSPTSEITLTFDQVTVSGNTSVATAAVSPAAPAGYQPSSKIMYNPATSASFTKSVAVCLNYDERTLTGVEDDFRLMNLVSGNWVDITASQNTSANQLCGVAQAFSSFTIMTAVNTVPGTNVSITPTGETLITFTNIVTAGFTTVTVVTQPTEAIPSGFQLASETTVYQIKTTATFSGPIEVCFTYDETTLHAKESDLRLMHSSGGVWTDITTSLDTVKNVICGKTESLSPFAIMVAPTVSGLIDLLTAMNLQTGAERSLLEQLKEAQRWLDKDKKQGKDNATDKAVKKLQEFIKKVQSQEGNKITPAQAEALVKYAENLVKLLLGEKIF